MPAGHDEVDVRIELGAVPEALPGAEWVEGQFQVEPARVLFHIEGVAGYLVERGKTIRLDPATGTAARDVRAYLLGSAWGALCHQRGLLPLHASAIATASGLTAFAGPSGIGKSTLVAALMRRDHLVATDDVLVVQSGGGNPLLASPHVQRLKLWPDSLHAVDLSPEGRDSDVFTPAKWLVPLCPQAARGMRPLRRIYLLEDADDVGAITIERLAGARRSRS